jgi:hypothetical protein
MVRSWICTALPAIAGTADMVRASAPIDYLILKPTTTTALEPVSIRNRGALRPRQPNRS